MSSPLSQDPRDRHVLIRCKCLLYRNKKSQEHSAPGSSFDHTKKLSVISRRRDQSTAPSPVRMKELAPRLVDALVRMRAKEVALRLQQIRRQPLRPVAVIERQRRGES